MRLVFDIEADNLYRHVTKIHCICVEDIDTGEHWAYGPDELVQALKNLSQATLLVAHNGCGYDIPVLKKILGWTPPKGVEIRDTMVWGSLCFSNLKELDFASNDPEIRGLSGSQSLEAWGKRLGEHKQDYQGGFEQFTPEMLEYCSQDVKTTKTLFKYLEKQYYSLEALKLEQRIHYEYSMMEYRGIAFDKEAAENLAERLQNELQRLQAEINGYVPPLKIEKTTPQFWSIQWPDESSDTFPTKGEAETERKRRKIRPRDVVLTRGPNKFEIKEFNPGSSKQVRDYFVEKYGWISPKLTDTGQEKFKKKEGTYEDLAKEYGSTEEDILRTLEWPEAEIIADYGMVSKVYSMAVSGSSAWLEQLAEDGRMHPRFRHIGAVTHRSSSAAPNIQQVPSVSLNKETGEPLWGAKGRFGAECRALFIADPGHWIVGMDLSGIEARMLAHFLEPFDQGAYIDQVLNGDIHQLNVTAIEEFAGYSIKRSDTKPMYYGKLYSIGNVKQGQVVVDASEQAKAEFKDLTSYYEKNPSKIRRHAYIGRSKTPLRPSECAFADIGEKVNTALTKGIAGLEELDTQVKQAAKRGYLAPLDMRHIPMRTLFDEDSGKGKIKTNAALNTLLQGSAGIVFKRAVVSVSNEMRKKRIPGQFLLVCHDELQTQVREGYEEEFTEVALAGPRRAGEYYGLKIPIEGETKCGRSWLETH